MAPGSRTRTVLNLIGGGLGAAGLVFVAFSLARYWTDIDTARIGLAGYAILAGLALLSCASNLLLAIGWLGLLRHLGLQPSAGLTIRVYAMSQLAKYVPGNVMQFVGRQALGVAAGMGNGPLLKSTGLELALLVGAGLLFVPLALPLFVDWFPGPLALGAFVAVAAACGWLLYRSGGAKLAGAALSYLAFLAIAGFLFVGVFWVAGGAAELGSVPAIAGAYVLAWLAGLVTPGAPAGIGVREAVLLFLLQDLSTAPVILLAVVLSRAVSVVGDASFFLFGGALARAA